MPQLSHKAHQIRQSHAVLIHQAVKACQNQQDAQRLAPMLKIASDQGWNDLVKIIKLILNGRRNSELLNGLDEEDSVIIGAILQGLQNPASLPDLQQQAEPTMAAPGIAHMIHAANHGDTQALQALGFMAEQMTNTEGDMRLLGGQMKRLLDGERNIRILCKGMSGSGEKLMQDILEELNKLAEQ